MNNSFHLGNLARVLTTSASPVHTGLAPFNSGAGFGDLRQHRRTTATRRLFCVRNSLGAPSMGGPGGDTFGYAGFLCSRFANPARFRSPFWRGVAEFQTANIGGHYHG